MSDPDQIVIDLEVAVHERNVEHNALVEAGGKRHKIGEHVLRIAETLRRRQGVETP